MCLLQDAVRQPRKGGRTQPEPAEHRVAGVATWRASHTRHVNVSRQRVAVAAVTPAEAHSLRGKHVTSSVVVAVAAVTTAEAHTLRGKHMTSSVVVAVAAVTPVEAHSLRGKHMTSSVVVAVAAVTPAEAHSLHGKHVTSSVEEMSSFVDVTA